MTAYMLDTTCFVLLAKRNSVAKAAVERLGAGDHQLGTCAVTIAEYYAGRRRGERPDVDDLIDGLDCWSLIYLDGLRGGEYRRTLRERGIQVTTPDMLIAAVAQRVGATVITENLKDFAVPGVKAISLLSV